MVCPSSEAKYYSLCWGDSTVPELDLCLTPIDHVQCLMCAARQKKSSVGAEATDSLMTPDRRQRSKISSSQSQRMHLLHSVEAVEICCCCFWCWCCYCCFWCCCYRWRWWHCPLSGIHYRHACLRKAAIYANNVLAVSRPYLLARIKTTSSLNHSLLVCLNPLSCFYGTVFCQGFGNAVWGLTSLPCRWSFYPTHLAL